MKSVLVSAVAIDVPLLCFFFFGVVDPELFLEPHEDKLLVQAGRRSAPFIGNPAAIDDPALRQALHPALELLGRIAPNRFPVLDWPRPLLLLAAEGTRWLTEKTYGLHATPSALLRARDALGSLEAVLANARTSRRLPDYAIQLSRVNRALGEIAPAITISIDDGMSTSVDWKQSA